MNIYRMTKFLMTALAFVSLALALVSGGGPVVGVAAQDPPFGGQSAPAPKTLDDLFFDVAKLVPAFGGMFIGADQKLHVYLLDPAQATAAEAAIKTVFGSGRIPERGVAVLQGKYSFLQLKTWHDRQRRATLAIRGVVRASIRESNNRLEIGVKDSVAAGEVESQLAALAIPRDAVDIVEAPPFKTQQTLRDKTRPVVGGLQIFRSGGGTCTLGFPAVRQGVAGFVTNSHCTSLFGGVDGALFHQANVVPGLTERFGVETADPQLFTGGNCPDGRQCRYSDSIFVRRDSGPSQSVPLTPADFGRIALTSGGLTLSDDSYFIDHEIPFSFEGERLIKVGRTTGQTEGDVCDTCADVNQNDTNGNDSGRTMLCQDLVAANSGPGDSGSPVFSPGANPMPGGSPFASLRGILWGGTGSVFIFSNMANVERASELGQLQTAQFEIGANSPPEVKITTPLSGASVPLEGIGGVQFEADVVDYESHVNFIQLKWESDVDGLMGFGKSLAYSFPSAGVRTVTVTATDDGGAVDTFAINVTVSSNTPPSADIIKPTPGLTLYKNFPYVLEGKAWDVETFQWLACGALTWTSSKAGDPFPKTGCQPQVTFATTGSRTITLAATDPHGATDTDTVTVNVVEPPANSPPLVVILNPSDNVYLNPFAWITLKGKADDPDNESPISYQWVLRRSDGTETILGSGSANDAQQFTLKWKPSNNVGFSCGGSTVRIYLRATDPDGDQGSTYITATIGYDPC